MKINLVVLKTSSPSDLASFYTQLGLNFEIHRHGAGPLHYAANVEGVVFEIYPLPKNKEKADDTLRLGFTVKHLDGIIENLRSAQAKISAEPILNEWGYVAIIEDPDGRKIELKDSERMS